MMLNEQIRAQIHSLGIGEAKIFQQLNIFERGFSYIRLAKPCTTGDGIRVIAEREQETLSSIYEKSLPDKVCLKFVPASGAASRMFKTLALLNQSAHEIRKEEFMGPTRTGGKENQEILAFMKGIRRFAFYDDLRAVMAENGLDSDVLIDQDHFKDVFAHLLTEKGLGYAQIPKGLVKFHQYPQENRTAFEEHLVEATGYIKGKDCLCRLHFTVPPEHEERFKELLDRVRPKYESRYNVRFEIVFSSQKRGTDTIAVDLKNRPFVQRDGSVLFRPGGHGALIENLNDVKADIIFIKNIDNVVPDRLKGPTFRWKKILGGYLIRLQQRLFSFLQRLNSGMEDDRLIGEAFDFARSELDIIPPADAKTWTDHKRRTFLLGKLNRPLRVCGMVKNEGEPGGGPFWVRDKWGELSLQLVESTQVDPKSDEQQAVIEASTHFSPVDIVCGVLNWQGNAFDLSRYVDHDAVLIVRKSKEGRELKALELPGLWNGGMAHWNTVFVEVPSITFNPVKTVNDLLRPEHLP